MKIITLYESEETLIKKALKRDAKAEEKLFKRHAPRMLSVCRNYISDLHYAEDVMITGFTKVFDNLQRFRFEGSFEGWIRRIMVREAIDFLRSRKQMQFTEVEEAHFISIDADPDDFDTDALQMMIDSLPDGYRTVLVMYAVEGYSHKEIASILGVSESTSKTQLFKARKLLQNQLSNQKTTAHGQEF
ncbi:RNA polymerase sigma factor [Flavobacterium selenitireducens]|uniref:RNA polymerase sigma factor n=1 Tax=Flavobacterium selenitireducens TaxID=2722704 RepID=UPI00168B8DA9|nr:RNA polymerase sigma factor [Flavobacterium selenitireducens]MBD3582889.1 RNA polymerase sigma factor [Flavobacterium selenitireducens]